MKMKISRLHKYHKDPSLRPFSEGYHGSKSWQTLGNKEVSRAMLAHEVDTWERYYLLRQSGHVPASAILRWLRYDTWSHGLAVALLLGFDNAAMPDADLLHEWEFSSDVNPFFFDHDDEYWVCDELLLPYPGIFFPCYEAAYAVETDRYLPDAERDFEQHYDPAILYDRYLKSIDQVKGIYSQYCDMLDNLKNSTLHKRDTPRSYIKWAERYGFDIPWLAWAREQGLVSTNGKIGAIGSADGNPVNDGERNMLYRILLGMAIDGYGYDPKAARNDATGENRGSIAAGLQKIDGLATEADTIRKYLKQAAELYPEAKPRKH